MDEPHYDFQIPTPQGPMPLRIPHSAMARCRCGCGLFKMLYRVTWVKPRNILNAPLICCQQPVYVCESCCHELNPPQPEPAGKLLET